jgi:hypothetical protein
MLRRRQTIGTVLFVAPLLFLSTSCYSPLQITWDDRQPVLSPQDSQRLLRPQGLLIVYSEHYDKPEEDSPLSAARRPTRAYSAEGRRPSTGPEKRSAPRAGQRVGGEKSPAAGGRQRGV